MTQAQRFVIVALLVAVAVAAALYVMLFHEPDATPIDVSSACESAQRETGAAATLQGRPGGEKVTGGDATRTPTVSETPSSGDLAEGDVLLCGRVVDSEGRPSPMASLEVLHEAQTIARGTSTADGTFVLHLPAARIAGTWRGRLRAEDAAGYQALRAVEWGPRPDVPQRVSVWGGPVVDVGTVRLGRTHALDIQVHFPEGASAPATVQVKVPDRGIFFQPIFAVDTQPTDEHGRLHVEGLPEGTLRVLALAPGCGRGVGTVTLPQEEAEVFVIDLPPERIVTLEVVDAATKAPIAGAEVTAEERFQVPGTSYSTAAPWWPPLEPARTDAAGHLVIRGLAPGQRLRFAANAGGYPPVPSPSASFGTARLEPDVTEVRIELPPPRTVRWPIEEGPVPPPAEGTLIAIRPSPGTYLADLQIPKEGRIEAGDLVVGGWPPGPLHGQAVAPNGSIARLFAKHEADTGMPTTFFPARRVEVLLRHPDGEPVEGLWVNLRNQGNNPIARSTPTDVEGRAVIEGLHGGPHALAEVHVVEKGRPWGGVSLGTVDLEKGDGHVEGVVERIREALLRFTLDGECRLPAEPSINLAGTRPRTPERDEEAGELRFSWRPLPGQPEARLNIQAEGWLPFQAKAAVPPEGTPLVLDVALERAGAFGVRVQAPEDGQVQVAVQRWNVEKEAWDRPLWLPMTRMGGYAKPDANGRIRFAPLATGRYRALDQVTGIVTPPVEVAPGGGEPEVVLDASRSGWARGEVVLPEGIDPAGVLVHVDGVGAFLNLQSGIAGAKGIVARVQKDGTFWIRVPGDREVVLRPEGLTLRPRDGTGTARITAPQDGIVLELVRAHRAVVTLGRAMPPSRFRGGTITRTVLLYASEVAGEPTIRTKAAVEDDGRTLVFGAFEPGTFTIWIDADPFIPVVLERRVLGEGETDLGEVEVSDGAQIALELLLPEGQAAPRAYARATRQGETAYTRSVNWQGPRAVLTGLEPGRYEVRVGSHMGGALHHVETVDVAEGEEPSVTIDMR